MSFSEIGDRIVEGVTAGLYEAGTAIMAESQQLVPVEYGTLKRSGRVEEPVADGDTVTVTVGYGYGTEYEERVAEQDAEDPAGDADSPGYAIYVHEIEGYRHAPPTTAKFLERPARAFEPQLGAVLDENVRARLES